MKPEGFEYKYNEDELLKQIAEYIDSTYSAHYSHNRFQATEFIIDSNHGLGFTIGNIMKYAQRYGKKGTPDDWRKDLLKVIHYAIIALHVHDKDYEKQCPDACENTKTALNEYFSEAKRNFHCPENYFRPTINDTRI